MARPKVPHCKNCPHLDGYSITWNITKPERTRHICGKKEKIITGQEVRTSPTWCPQRIGFSERYRKKFEK